MALSAKQKAERAAKAARQATPTTTPTIEQLATAAGAAPEAPTIRKSGDIAGENQSTVFVASKMPRGLYLQTHSFINQDVRVMGGGVEKRQVAVRNPEKFRIKPAVLAFGLIPNFPIVNGFSITKDVPSQLWRDFVQQNPNLELLTTGMLAGFNSEADAIAYANEYGKLRTGLEPIDPAGDARIEQVNNPNLGDVEIDDGK